VLEKELCQSVWVGQAPGQYYLQNARVASARAVMGQLQAWTNPAV